MRAKFIILFFFVISSFGAYATGSVNYCDDVAAPQDFLIQLQFSDIPISFTLDEEHADLEEEYEVLFTAEPDIDAVRFQQSSSTQAFGINRRADKAEIHFPNLVKAVNAQYETRAQRLPKPSYYHYLFRLYPF